MAYPYSKGKMSCWACGRLMDLNEEPGVVCVTCYRRRERRRADEARAAWRAANPEAAAAVDAEKAAWRAAHPLAVAEDEAKAAEWRAAAAGLTK